MANCFWATKFYFDEKCFPPKKLSGNEILQFIAMHFQQVDVLQDNDVVIIWSSSDESISPPKVEVAALAKYPPGFPFALVIEHTCVYLNDSHIFQKASPKNEYMFEVVSPEKMIFPYEKLSWIRKTYHRFHSL